MSNDCNAKINKKSWSTDEDAKLLKLIEELGVSGSWTMISSRMGDRSGKQCRERYHNHLKADINKSAFTKEEDDLVNELQLKLGNQWAKISKYFNGRSDNAVKNRWHIINRSKPVAENSSAQVVIPNKKPVVPMLALNLSHSISAPLRVVDNPVSALSGNMDLLSLYHSHCEYAHEPTLSSRSVMPASGRRSVHYTSVCSSSDSECEDGDAWLDDLISGSYYSDSNTSEEDEEEWSSGSDSEADLIVSGDVFELSAHPVAPTATTNNAPGQLVFDAFSEAAITHRDDPEDFEFDDDCFDFTNDADYLQLESVIGVKLSPVGIKSAPLLLNKAHPRLTPRSPACPITIKRQRGAQPGGSPFIKM